MRPTSDTENPNRYDYWDVSQAAGVLSNQACTLAARHINDGMLRIQFNREISYYAKSIVDDVAEGKKTPEQAIDEIQNEQRSLLSQAADIAQKGIGVAAGAMQVVAGGGMCYTSAGILCAFVGAPLMAHGANNMYENGRNLWEDRSDAQGPVREVYRSAAKAMGRSEFEADIAYGAVDLGMSAYGVGRLVLKPDAWRLFKYIRTDYVRAYKNSSVGVFLLDRTADAITADGILESWKKNK